MASARDWRHEEVLEACQGLVLNMNRRVPDEGAVAEAAMAWVAGKATVLYKAASGSLIQGSDNPLVLASGTSSASPPFPRSPTPSRSFSVLDARARRRSCPAHFHAAEPNSAQPTGRPVRSRTRYRMFSPTVLRWPR